MSFSSVTARDGNKSGSESESESRLLDILNLILMNLFSLDSDSMILSLVFSGFGYLDSVICRFRTHILNPYPDSKPKLGF